MDKITINDYSKSKDFSQYEKVVVDLDEEREKFAPPQEKITEISALLIMLGARPTPSVNKTLYTGKHDETITTALYTGKHDEIIFNYERILENGQRVFDQFNVSGSRIIDPKEYKQLMWQIDNCFGLPSTKADGTPSSLEDRFTVAETKLLSKFKNHNDVTEEYAPHGSRVYDGQWLEEITHKFKEQNPNENFDLTDSVLAGNTDAEMLASGQGSLDLAIKTRGFIAKVTQAEMMKKPALATYINKQDEYRNENTDLSMFVDRRLAHISKVALSDKYRPGPDFMR